MAEKPVGAIALDSPLAEEAGYSDSTTKPNSRKKYTERRRGESTESIKIFLLCTYTVHRISLRFFYYAHILYIG